MVRGRRELYFTSACNTYVKLNLGTCTWLLHIEEAFVHKKVLNKDYEFIPARELNTPKCHTHELKQVKAKR